MTVLTWEDNGAAPNTLLMAYSHRHYVGFIHKSANYVRWNWGFRDAGRWVHGDCRRKHDAKRRIEAHWRRFCAAAGLVDTP